MVSDVAEKDNLSVNKCEAVTYLSRLNHSNDLMFAIVHLYNEDHGFTRTFLVCTSDI